jgi:hypothetical protein
MKCEDLDQLQLATKELRPLLDNFKITKEPLLSVIQTKLHWSGFIVNHVEC